MKKNKHRIYGNVIIVGDGLYYSWHEDKLVGDKEIATGYASVRDAEYVILSIQSQYPNTIFSTIKD